ncbi:MAG TPA: D-2-hydroxyacid dehydrogenase [Sphingopyxis sp.]|nr:D-2-hydroxyacid dehydrogenase [Sphingopyxis sp.]
MSKSIAVMSALVRPLIEPHLPDWVEPHYFTTKEEALELAPLADIGWFDMNDRADMAATLMAATNLKWLTSIFAGLDGLPLDALAQRGVVVTNGAGINAITIAEYVVMGMLNIAKNYREVVRAQERHEWLFDSPGKVELYDSKALLLGYGAIGKLVEERLKAFGVDITVVRRSGGAGTLGPDEWRARLGEYDWVILAVPATAETDGMIGAAELAAMKKTATLVNIARGSVVDQEALVAALQNRTIGHAFLDVTTPEPLPPEHPLWDIDTAHITMHLSGRAQDKMFVRSAERFLDNLKRWKTGEALSPLVDLSLGY